MASEIVDNWIKWNYYCKGKQIICVHTNQTKVWISIKHEVDGKGMRPCSIDTNDPKIM